MARGVNKVILIGNLGNDPDTRHTAGGNPVTNLSIATSESWTDKNTNQRNEKTEWHKVVLFGKLAEIAQQYLKKGSKVYLEGKLQTRKWQTQSGEDRYSTEIVADGFSGQMQMLDGRDGQQSTSQPQHQHQPQHQQQTAAAARQQPNAYAQASQGSNVAHQHAQQTPFDGAFSDDIPF